MWRAEFKDIFPLTQMLLLVWIHLKLQRSPFILVDLRLPVCDPVFVLLPIKQLVKKNSTPFMSFFRLITGCPCQTCLSRRPRGSVFLGRRERPLNVTARHWQLTSCWHHVHVISLNSIISVIRPTVLLVSIYMANACSPCDGAESTQTAEGASAC